MGVIRITKHEAPYVMLDKTALKDKRLSFRAKGLHAYLMSKPDDWTIHIEDLVKQSPSDGRESVAKGLKDLETCGYIRRRRTRDERGRMSGWDTVVYETPWLATMADEDAQLTGDVPKSVLPTSAKPISVDTLESLDTSGLPPKTDSPTSVKPISDSPKTDSPKSANPQLLKKETTQRNETTKTEDTPLPPYSETGEAAPAVDEPPPKKKRGRQATPKHPFPDQFLLTGAMKTWAQENARHINVAQETKKFAAHWRGRGEWMSNWSACWEKWMLNAEGWLQEKYPELATTRTPGQAISHDEVEL